jgi:hypothetical protein
MSWVTSDCMVEKDKKVSISKLKHHSVWNGMSIEWVNQVIFDTPFNRNCKIWILVNAIRYEVGVYYGYI